MHRFAEAVALVWRHTACAILQPNAALWELDETGRWSGAAAPQSRFPRCPVAARGPRCEYAVRSSGHAGYYPVSARVAAVRGTLTDDRE